ncbi:hypothetical protein BBta_3791 [Bradyrhizobium sp. BTAi1]|nr:hypothetical protein BBta_3791 [Bradyrhizobium sp. BTAi1]
MSSRRCDDVVLVTLVILPGGVQMDDYCPHTG